MLSNEFRPDWTSAPGDTILDILQEQEITKSEFAQQMGCTSENLEDLLQGRSTITIAVARRLEEVLGASVTFWMSRDYQYRQDTTRIIGAHKEWLSEIPVGEMIKFGWLRPIPRPEEELAACLRFFDVPNLQVWKEKYEGLLQMAAFRTSPSFDSQPAAVAAWLRQGEIEAENIECQPWNAIQFQESLLAVRSLTRLKDPRLFLPKLQSICAESGVAVVIVRAPNGCRASGATRFLTRDKALLMLSFRHLTDDQFWFTFFHEAAHLIIHGDEGLLLEGMEPISKSLEQEADDFAEQVLIPPEFKSEMLNLPLDRRTVIKFATHIGIAPGIVVGQLQYHERISYRDLNRLKRRYQWED